MNIQIIKDGIEREMPAAELIRDFLNGKSVQLKRYEAGYDFPPLFLEWLGERHTINARISADQLCEELNIVIEDME